VSTVSRFKSWEAIRHHCEVSELHPLKTFFCSAGSDSLKRHYESPPLERREAVPDSAEERRRVTENAHEDFKKTLEAGEEIEVPFSHFIKNMYPASSKRCMFQLRTVFRHTTQSID